MITPNPKNYSTNQQRNELLDNSNVKQNEEIQWTNAIKENFYRNLGYTQVSKNFKNNTLYDTCIYEGVTKDQDVPYKRLLSYPYDSIQFQRGDYIHFKYGGIDTTWLLTTLDSQFLYDVNGRMYLCNETLKWIDDNKILQEYPCVIEDRQSKQGLFDFNPNIKLATGIIYVDVQYNVDTQKIKEDYRFVLKGQAFRVSFVNPFSTGNCATLTLVKDQIALDDDVINDIPNTNDYTPVTPPSNGLW